MTAVETERGVSPSPVPLMLRADADRAVDRAIRRGELIRVERGVYADRGAWTRLRRWERYLARVHAVALTRPHAVFSAESAAALWGMPVVDQQEVHLLVTDPHLAREISGVRSHASRDARDVRRASGIWLVAPDEAAVDIARRRHPGIALMAADGALRVMRERTRADLLALNEARLSSRGRVRARWALGRATPLAETALESVSRAVIEWLGFPEPVLQQSFLGPHGERWRTDAYWPREGVIGEADGRLKYDGEHGMAAVVEEKRREDALRRRAAGFARWMWADVEDSRRLRDILRAAGLQEERPPRPALLASIEADLRAARETAGGR